MGQDWEHLLMSVLGMPDGFYFEEFQINEEGMEQKCMDHATDK